MMQVTEQLSVCKNYVKELVYEYFPYCASGISFSLTTVQQCMINNLNKVKLQESKTWKNPFNAVLTSHGNRLLLRPAAYSGFYQTVLQSQIPQGAPHTGVMWAVQ